MNFTQQLQNLKMKKEYITISELIKKLDSLQDAYGNVPVMVGTDLCYKAVTGVGINSSNPQELAMVIINHKD